MQFIDFAVRLDQPHLAGNRYAARRLSGTGSVAAPRRKVSLAKVRQHGHVAALRQAGFRGSRRCRHRHAAPSGASCAGTRAPDVPCRGCCPISSASASSQLRPAILLDVPVMGADILEEFGARICIGNQLHETQMRVVVDQHLADIEDDMLDCLRHCLPLVLDDENASGIATAITFFMTLGKASSPSFSTGTHQPSGKRALSTLSSDQTSSSRSKCVKTWRTVPSWCHSPAKGAWAIPVPPSARTVQLVRGHARHAAQQAPRPDAFAGKPRRHALRST